MTDCVTCAITSTGELKLQDIVDIKKFKKRHLKLKSRVAKISWVRLCIAFHEICLLRTTFIKTKAPDRIEPTINTNHVGQK